MRVVVNKNSLKHALKILLAEQEEERSNIIISDDDDEPIKPVDQMSTQLSVELPPVSDPDYVPVNTSELSKAASVIADEVPDDQIDYFYRKLHTLLDSALDRESDSELEDEESVERQEKQDVDAIMSREEELNESAAMFLLEQDALDDDEDDDEVEIDEEEEDRIFQGLDSGDPIEQVVDSIRTLRDNIIKDRQNAIMSADAGRSDAIESQYGWMFYAPDQAHIGLPWMIIKAVETQEVNKDFEEARKELGVEKRDLIKMVIEKYRTQEPSPSKPLSDNPALAAEMYSNVILDSWKTNNEISPETGIDQFRSAINKKMDDVQSKGAIEASFSERTGEPPLKVQIPSNIFLPIFQNVSDKRIDAYEEEQQEPEEFDDFDLAAAKKEYKAREKSDRQKIADDLGISYGALTNVEQDMAVALGPRRKGASQRAPNTADEDKLAMYKKMYDAFLEKLASLVGESMIKPIFMSKKGMDEKSLDQDQINTINNASIRIAHEIIDYDKKNMKFSNSEIKEVFSEFLSDFVRHIDKDTTGPLFDELEDYADFKDGGGEFVGRDDFTDKDVRETSSTAKNLSYLVRNIFNVGYELEARAEMLKKQSREAVNSGDTKRARNLRRESEEYREDALKYMTRSKEIVGAITATEIPDKLSKKYIKKLEKVIEMGYGKDEPA